MWGGFRVFVHRCLFVCVCVCLCARVSWRSPGIQAPVLHPYYGCMRIQNPLRLLSTDTTRVRLGFLLMLRRLGILQVLVSGFYDVGL